VVVTGAVTSFPGRLARALLSLALLTTRVSHLLVRLYQSLV